MNHQPPPTGPAGIVGYGTLLSRASLARTVGEGAARRARFLPVRVRGYRRLFNLRPDHYEPSLHDSSEPIEAAAANLERREEAHFNGVLFTLDPLALDALHQRERYYDRVRVQVEPVPSWDSPSEELESNGAEAPPDGFLPTEALIYVGRPDTPWVEPWLGAGPERLLPLWRDIVLARGAAYRIGPEFGEGYDATTYLADGSTLVAEWYGNALPDPFDATLP